MSHNKKIAYGAILGVAALACGIDQLFLGEATGPSQVQAAAGGLASPPSNTTIQTAPRLFVTATPFPSQLPGLTESDPLRDLFSITDEVRTLLLGSTSANAGAGASGDGSSRRRNQYRTVEGFPPQHRLEAVIVAGSHVGAVVDGAWIQVGQSIDECRLLRIEGRTAVFQCIDGEATIAVGGDGPLGPATR